MERLSQWEPRDLVSRVDWSARGCLQGAGVNIMTGAVRVMDGEDTDTAPHVDTEFCLLLNGLY